MLELRKLYNLSKVDFFKDNMSANEYDISYLFRLLSLILAIFVSKEEDSPRRWVGSTKANKKRGNET